MASRELAARLLWHSLSNTQQMLLLEQGPFQGPYGTSPAALPSGAGCSASGVGQVSGSAPAALGSRGEVSRVAAIEPRLQEAPNLLGAPQKTHF